MHYFRGSKPGFTLVELLVTVALIGLLLSVAAAYVTGSNYGLRTAAFNLRSALQKARLEAIKRNISVYLNLGTQPVSYLMWGDIDNDATYSANELIETIQGAQDTAYGSAPDSAGGPTKDPVDGSSLPTDGISLLGSNPRAKFSSDGTSSAGTIYLHIPSTPSAGTYAIVISSTGRTRIWYFQPGASSWKQL